MPFFEFLGWRGQLFKLSTVWAHKLSINERGLVHGARYRFHTQATLELLAFRVIN